MGVMIDRYCASDAVLPTSVKLDIDDMVDVVQRSWIASTSFSPLR